MNKKASDIESPKVIIKPMSDSEIFSDIAQGDNGFFAWRESLPYDESVLERLELRLLLHRPDYDH